MATFNCEDPVVQSQLDRLATLILNEGGFLHDDLLIEQQGPSLSVSSKLSAASNDVIIQIPRHCLIPIENFNIAAQENGFIITPREAIKHPVQIEIAQLMFDVFNQTAKLGFHLLTSPYFCFREEPAIVSALKKLRPNQAEYFEMQEAGHAGEAIVSSFLKTRTLSNQRTADEPSSRVLMPFVDYLNHHTQATSYQFHDKDDGSEYLQVHNCKPANDNDEVFVRYSRNLDLIDTYIGYGFRDTLSTHDFVRSVPVTLEYEEYGKLVINSAMAPAFMGQLGPRNKDLRRWLPTLSRGEDDRELVASHLFIPCRHSKLALKRALGVLWRSLNPDIRDLTDVIELSEQVILETNEQSLHALADCTENPVCADTSAEALQSLNDICTQQLQMLQAYRTMNGS